MSVGNLLERLAQQGVELWFEGERLRFRAPKETLTGEQRTELSARRKEIIAKLRAAAGAQGKTFPLSFSQRSVWFEQQQAPDNWAYNVVMAVHIGGGVDVAAVRQALQALVDRHAVLRTSYDLVEGALFQRVAGTGTAAFDAHAVPNLTDDELWDLINVDCHRPFDLRSGPVFRASLYTRGPADHVLLLAVHHIAVDAWSLWLLFDELFKLYVEATGGAPAGLPRSELQYADYVSWQERTLAGTEGERLWTYWRKKLAPPRQRLELGSDHPRPAVRTFRGATVPVQLDVDLTQRVEDLARREDTTPFVVLLACFQVFLSRHTGVNDVIVGTPTFGRNKAEFMRVVGDFVNSLPLRGRLSAAMTFREFVRQMRQTVIEALDTQEFPLLLLVQRLQPERESGHLPLFDTFFNLVQFEQAKHIEALATGDGSEDPVNINNLWLRAYPLNQQEGQFDLAVLLGERDGAFRGSFTYRTDLFKEATVHGFVTEYVALVEGLTANPDTSLGGHAIPAGRALTSNRDVAAPTDQFRERSVTGNSVPSSAQVSQSNDQVSLEKTPLNDSPSRDESVEQLIQRLKDLGYCFSVDSGRLKVNAPKAAMDDTIRATIGARRTEIINALSSQSTKDLAGAAKPLRRIPRTPPLPLSAVQRRFWFVDRFEQGRGGHNVSVVLRLDGVADLRAITDAVEYIVARHECLRMRIGERDDEPYPEINLTPEELLEVVDLTNKLEREPETEGLRLAREAINAKFDLARGPLARFLLIRVSPDLHFFVVNMHHIVADGWSLSIAVREFGARYSALTSKTEMNIADLPLQYADYAAWEGEQVRGGLFDGQLAYWQARLAGAPNLLELPTDRVRPPAQSFEGGRVDRIIDPDLADDIVRYCRRRDVTPFMAILAVLQVLLHRISGQDDIVIGTPVANRGIPELENVIGPFVNSFALRMSLAENPVFSEFLTQVRQVTIDAIDNRDVPFDLVVEAINPQRSLGHAPIFQVMFALHNVPLQEPNVGELKCTIFRPETRTAQLDLTIEMAMYQDKLFAAYEYATDLFDRGTIERMHDNLMRLLREIVKDDGRRVSDLPMLSSHDERTLVDEWNDTAVEHDRGRCVHHLFEKVARETPDARAVIVGSDTFTYRQIDEHANRLAHLLRRRDVAAGDRVAICLDRGVDMPVTMAAVLKAGAAYIPLDPTHPADRLRYILEDAKVTGVITQRRFATLFAENETVVFLDELGTELDQVPTTSPEVAARPEELAYIIYTSGSTGRPKGVQVEHRNVVNFLESMRREPGLGATDALLAVTTLAFDIAGLEIWLPLSVGASLVIASREDVLVGERLIALLDQHQVTVMQATPSTWRQMLETEWAGKSDLKVLCGGEPLPRDLAAALTGRVYQLWNMYGPTETTIWSTICLVKDPSVAIPIGRPIANTRTYILEPSGSLAPVGAFGELAIAGEGVARGYWNRPELTAEKFVTLGLPNGRVERVYRTGDVARFRNDGQLDFYGRRDHQVKLRGYRIELGEIEQILASNSGVKQCVVAIRAQESDPQLVGYVVQSTETAFDLDSARSALRSKLPGYMVPSQFVILPALPLTSNGKIDRKALAAPERNIVQVADHASEVLMTPVQQRVADIWCKILKINRVSLHDNFFDIGGHSMLIVKLHGALQRELDTDLALIELFQQTTVALQAERVSSAVVSELAVQRAQARARKRLHV